MIWVSKKGLDSRVAVSQADFVKIMNMRCRNKKYNLKLHYLVPPHSVFMYKKSPRQHYPNLFKGI